MSQTHSGLETLADGSKAYVHVWQPSVPARAVVQIVHGMAEHGGRYARFAHALNAAGFAVYAQDLPGHGQTAENLAQLGYVAGANPFRQMLAAVNQVRAMIETQHPRLPLVLFGHSMGSFVAQHSVVEHGEGLAACVLSGTTGNLGPLRRVGWLINRVQLKVLGPHHRSALTDALTFKAFNRKFSPNRTSADWLSRDPSEVDAYLSSPYCGFRCAPGLWASLLAAGADLGHKSALQRIPKSLPLLLISGDQDPVCEGAKGPAALAAAYQKAGLKAEAKAYSGARHELLNETNREEVTQDLLHWLARNVYTEPSR